MADRRKRILLWVLAAEILVLLCLLVRYARWGYEETFSAAELESGTEAEARTPLLELPRGFYVVDIRADFGEEGSGQAEGESGLAEPLSESVYVATECPDTDRTYAVDSDLVTLTPYQTEAVYRIYVREGGAGLRVMAWGEDGAPIRIGSVRIEYLRKATVLTEVLGWAFLFALLDALLWIFALRVSRYWDAQRRRTLMTLLIATLLASFPLFGSRLPFGHDQYFQLQRIEGIAEGLGKVFPVRIQATWCNGYGYAVGVCYGDLFLYLPALLRRIGFPLRTVYKFYAVGATFLTAAISCCCFGRISGSRRIGRAASVLYTLSLWRLVDVYTRAAVGEYTAMAFLPLVMLGFWDLLREDAEEPGEGDRSGGGGGRLWHLRARLADPAVLCLVIGFTGLIESHVISTVMAGIFGAAACLLCWRRFFRRETLLRTALAAGITLLLNAGFLVPLLDYYLTVPMQINSAGATEAVQGWGVSLWQIFAPVTGNAKEWNYWYTYLLMEMPVGIGFAALLSILAGAYRCAASGDGREQSRIGRVLVLTGLSIFLCTLYFPYDWLMEHLPALYKLLSSVQYPWRFLTVATLLATLLFALAAAGMEREEGGALPAFLLGICAIALVQAVSYQADFASDPKDIGDISAVDAAHLSGFDSVVEYLPELLESDDLYLLQKDTRIYASGEEIGFGELQTGRLSFEMNLTNASAEDGWAEFPLLAYKGYRAQIASGGELEVEPGDLYRVRVTVPAGFSGAVKVRFREPWYWRCAEALSLLTAAGIVWLRRPLRRRL